MADKKGGACAAPSTPCGCRLIATIDAASWCLPSASAPAGALPPSAAASSRTPIWRGGRWTVQRGLRWSRGRRWWRVRTASLRPAPAPSGHTGAEPAAADVQPGGSYVRRSSRLSRVHWLPCAVLPLLPNSGSAIHPAAAPYHHDTERLRGERQVRGARADAVAARAARCAAVARTSRRPAAAPSAVALNKYIPRKPHR
ncbi:uncharacterized protein [Battus philenor]|uniref:uncharacterized protein isoform X2 n=1 Tax=Battus philenor TaxID=42288 RepID=UPI0035CFFB94